MEEHARSFMAAKRVTHEELNAIRATGQAVAREFSDSTDAHRRWVEKAFHRAEVALALERSR